jgi:hypothetical protein
LGRAASEVSFGDICAGLTEWVDELNAPLRAAGFIARWVADALIAQVG